MSAFIVDPEHINVLIWAGRSAVSRSAGRAARELATAGGHLARSPLPFQPQQGRQAYTAGTPSPSTCTAAGSPVSARASPAARLPLRRAGPTALAPYASAPRALARPRAGRKSAYSFSASFQLTAPPHGVTADPR